MSGSRGCGVNEGESATSKAHELREQAAAARAEAARLTQEAAAWEAGAEGERLVAAALSALDSRPDVIVMHDRLLRPGRSQANLDHIVVSPGGTHLVDAKYWAGNVTVHQGSLWRHRPDGQGGRASQCMNGEVDRVRRMAEAMESLSSSVVEPVLCLTGRNAHAFGAAQLIRGVHVVRVDQVAQWLVGRERTQPDSAVPVIAQKLERSFPAATGPWSSLTSAPHDSGPILPLRRPGAGSTFNRANGGGATRRTGKPTPRRASEGRRFVKSLLGLLGMIAILLFGLPLLTAVLPFIASALTQVVAKPLAPASTSVGQPGQPSKTTPGRSGITSGPPCRALTDLQIGKALRVRVFPVATAMPDTCQWGLRLDDPSAVVASAATGWTPSFNTVANKANRAIYENGPVYHEVSIVVPQFAAVPGSKVPAARITQPIQVTLVTDRLSVHGRKFTSDQARAIVTRWADTVATAMPQGPGADSIHP